MVSFDYLNIVFIYDVGMVGGNCYYLMVFVCGEGFDVWFVWGFLFVKLVVKIFLMIFEVV